MMYYPDLSLYEYATYFGVDNPIQLPNVFNVGWLENGREFLQGDVDQPMLDILKQILVNPGYSIGFRGFHLCDLCDHFDDLMMGNLRGKQRSDHLPVVEVGDKSFRLGSNVLWIPSPSGKIYAAPNLIYHYIVEHHYRPPEEFLEAVRQYTPDLQWDGYAVYRDLVEKRRDELGTPPQRP